MRVSFFVAIVLSVGCFDSHPLGTEADPWGDCADALRAGAAERDYCAFTGRCSALTPTCGVGTVCEPGLACVDGRIRADEECIACPPPPRDGGTPDGSALDAEVLWTSCEAWRSGGGEVGARCTPGFGECVIELGECGESARCADGVVMTFGECVPVPVCPDYTPPPPEFTMCRRDAECAGDPCVPAGTELCGGAGCSFLPRECENDDGCSDGFCVEYSSRCACLAGSRCVSDCRLRDPGCPEGYSCQSGGQCLAVSCADGYSCPPNQECAIDVGLVDQHGCARLACERDSDCECGACVNARCEDGLGFCAPPLP